MNSAKDVLQSVFGYNTFRSPQDKIIQTIIDGNNALVIMPTGGGKSICYQIPSLVRSGCGIVISPLIALMKDQVDAMRQLGVKASFLNSTVNAKTIAETEQALLNGDLDLLYIAPERLKQSRTIKLLKASSIALFAIDEAHCVSQWGHDFRTDYLQLSLLHQQFPDIPRIALTATADARTRTEIANRLELVNAAHFISGFDRPNIRYNIALKSNPKQQILRFLQDEHPNDAGIIYCLSRNRTEEIASWLCDQGFNALPYHAGLNIKTRANNQSRFLREDSIIIVATIAFGMGIDKPNVRFVAHMDLPKTIESYYQETGRAGRDGEPANAWMIYSLQDVIKLRQMITESAGHEEHKRAEQHRLNAMLGLCEITSCRRQALLNYFDDTHASLEKCGNCDTCLEPVKTWDGTEAARMALSAAYRTGQHFGVGYLIDVLRAKNSDKISQNGHDQLPIYGIGKALNKNQWRSVFRQLVARGYLNVNLNRFSALYLQEKCRPLLRGEQTIALRYDNTNKTVQQQTKKPLPVDVDIELWEALRECRREFAEQHGVPPYIIFHDRTLQEICITIPQTLDQFSHISGVGERKLNKYGPEFLKVINTYLDSDNKGIK